MVSSVNAGTNWTMVQCARSLCPGERTRARREDRVLFSPDMRTVMLPGLGNEELPFLDRTLSQTP